MIAYFVEIIALQGLMWAWVKFGLLPSRDWTWIRVGLLLSLVLPFFIPFAEISLPRTTSSTISNWSGINTFEAMEVPWETTALRVTKNQLNFSWKTMISCLGLSISLVLCIRSFWGMYKLYQWKREASVIKIPHGSYWVHPKITSPFSFFNTVFVPAKLPTESLELILLHEYAHVNLCHSWDRLLSELVVALAWYSPFTWVLKKHLIEVHEFQADAKVLEKSTKPSEYQLFLLQFTLVQSPVWGSKINGCSTKLRIQMMREQRKGFPFIKKLAVTLLMAGVCLLWACENATPKLIAQVDGSSANWQPVVSKVSVVEVPDGTPMKNLTIDLLRSSFGMRKHPITKENIMHKGVDFAGQVGIPVLAAGNGIVRKAAFDADGYGYYVIIDHPGGYSTLYAQLSEFQVKEGESLQRGQVLGNVGSSGMSTAPHLHYEIMKDGKNINPMGIMKLSINYFPLDKQLDIDGKEISQSDKC